MPGSVVRPPGWAVSTMLHKDVLIVGQKTGQRLHPFGDKCEQGVLEICSGNRLLSGQSS